MPLLSFTKSKTIFDSATASQLRDSSNTFDLYSFLGFAQHLHIDFLPLTYQRALEDAGLGGTSNIRQAPVNAQMSFVFKCLRNKTKKEEGKAYRAMISEICVLGHPSVRNHPNISRLEGICWDIEITDNGHTTWPVLVFEKSPYGDLNSFSSSTIFRQMSLRRRLDLCVDIGTAILEMHKSNIIHGDIKPQNILIYDDMHKQYVAKVTDFGYSTIFCENDLIEMPISVPWNAPEHHHRGFDSVNALKMDVYSYGVVCLWLLFFNTETRTHIDFLNTIRCHSDLRDTAYSLVTGEAKQSKVSTTECTRLSHFFELALANVPQQRCSSFRILMQELGSKEIDVAVDSSMPQDELLHGNQGFQLISSLLQFYEVDYLVRSSVAQCLVQKAKASPVPATNSSREPAFQAALCYRLGFGFARDDEAARSMLESVNIPWDALEDTISLIKNMKDELRFRDGNFNRFQLQGKLSMIDLPVRYRELREMDKVQSIYEREIAGISSILGEFHAVTLSLKSTYCSILYSEGYWQRCVTIGIETLQGYIKVYGEFHRQTLQRKENLITYLIMQGAWNEAKDSAAQLLIDRSRILGEGHLDILASKSVLADAYLSGGNWKEAELLYQEIWETYRVNFGSDHPYTIQTMMALGSTLWHLGRYLEAEEIETQALDVSLKVLGRANQDTLLAMHNLAATLFNMGKMIEAEQLFHESLELRMDILGAVHPNTLTSLKFQATQLGSNGNWQQAETLQRRLVEIEQGSLPAEHPDLMNTRLCLALFLRQQGKLREAEELQSLVLKMSEAAYGQNHPRTLTAKLDLAATYYDQGEWNKAVVIERTVMDRNIKTLGKTHPTTLESMSSLAMTLTKLEQFSEAEALETEALKLKQNVLGSNHRDTLKCIANLVNIYSETDRNSEAEELGTQLVEMNKVVLGKSHPYTVTSMGNLASISSSTGRLSKAKKVYQEIINISIQELGPRHPDTLEWIASLANIYFRMSRYEAAERLQIATFEASIEALGKEHPDTLFRAYSLGSTWLYQDRFDEAEKLLAETTATEERVLGEEHSYTILAMENLALTLAKQGRFEEAERLERDVLEKRERLFGKEKVDTVDSREFLRRIVERDEIFPAESEEEWSDSSWESDSDEEIQIQASE